DGPPEPEPGPEPEEAVVLPPSPPVPVHRTVTHRAGEPAWSATALRTLGVPEGILQRLTIPEGADDQDWTMSMARALRNAPRAQPAGLPVAAGRRLAGRVSGLLGVLSGATAAEERARGEARFRALVQNATEVISVVDPAGNIGYLSPSAEQVFGYPPALLD